MAKNKATLLYDGDCNFCMRWVMRWKAFTGDDVDYRSYQEGKKDFPEISEEACRDAIHLAEPGNKVSKGAEAVFRTLNYKPSGSWLLKLYQKAAPFRWLSETFYSVVAQNRAFFSLWTRLLWGDVSKPTTYSIATGIFVRLLGLVYFFAFVSLATQVLGLLGSNGIRPVETFIDVVGATLKDARFWRVPTLLWFHTSDAMLLVLCWGGAALSILLMMGFLPVLILTILWVFYLSLLSVGQEFLSFQWDILLVEIGFLSIFLAPLHFRTVLKQGALPPSSIHWLFKWLLFRIMFSSGIVKLMSGDPTWAFATALEYHYETQPLPTWIGWLAHQLPDWFQWFSVKAMFAIELVIPFFIFLPRRPRHLACALLIGLQVLILLTGNYCFFNLLSIALCLLMLEDVFWQDGWFRGISWSEKRPQHPRWPKVIVGFIAVLILIPSTMQMTQTLRWNITWSDPFVKLYRHAHAFRLINGYGLFAVMTTSRLEIELEGSNDGKEWKTYVFKHKPGDLQQVPSFIAPHQPRLDWQMWFAALSSPQQSPWFTQFCYQLLKGSPEVLGLLKENPFEDQPPRFIRAVAYDYKFSDIETKLKTGAWWTRERKGLYMRTISLK